MNKAKIRVLEAGRHNVTDSRWNDRTANWLVTVKKDGTGVLSITPTRFDSAVMDVSANEDLREVTQMINKPDHASILAGFQNSMEGRRLAIFKLITYEGNS